MFNPEKNEMRKPEMRAQQILVSVKISVLAVSIKENLSKTLLLGCLNFLLSRPTTHGT